MKITLPTINESQHLFAKDFAAAVEKDLGGRIKAEIYPANQSGSIRGRSKVPSSTPFNVRLCRLNIWSAWTNASRSWRLPGLWISWSKLSVYTDRRRSKCCRPWLGQGAARCRIVRDTAVIDYCASANSPLDRPPWQEAQGHSLAISTRGIPAARRHDDRDEPGGRVTGPSAGHDRCRTQWHDHLHQHALWRCGEVHYRDQPADHLLHH